jgi:hypothetical protein
MLTLRPYASIRAPRAPPENPRDNYAKPVTVANCNST